MAVREEYYWNYIAPGATARLNIYGYGENDAVTYSVTPYEHSGIPFGPDPFISVTLTLEDVHRHPDGSVARTVSVRNNASFNDCAAKLLAIVG